MPDAPRINDFLLIGPDKEYEFNWSMPHSVKSVDPTMLHMENRSLKLHSTPPLAGPKSEMWYGNDGLEASCGTIICFGKNKTSGIALVVESKWMQNSPLVIGEASFAILQPLR
jgi:hypothetical protein